MAHRSQPSAACPVTQTNVRSIMARSTLRNMPELSAASGHVSSSGGRTLEVWQALARLPGHPPHRAASERLAKPARPNRRHFPPHPRSAIPAQAPPNRWEGPLTPPDTLRIPFGCPSDALRSGWLVPGYLLSTPRWAVRRLASAAIINPCRAGLDIPKLGAAPRHCRHLVGAQPSG